MRSAAASSTCSQLSITSNRILPSSAAATDSLTLVPGYWMMPSTAATASGTAAGSATESPDPIREFIGQMGRGLQRQAGLTDPTNPRQCD
jgi:hypothetical protein